LPFFGNFLNVLFELKYTQLYWNTIPVCIYNTPGFISRTRSNRWTQVGRDIQWSKTIWCSCNCLG